MALIAFLQWVFPIETAILYTQENGLIENLSVAGWFACGVALLVLSVARGWRGSLYGSVLMFLFGLRELDFQKKFTTISITKIKFYLSNEVSIFEKIIVLLIMTAVLIVLFKFLRITWSKFSEKLLKGHIPTLAIFSGSVALIISKGLDRYPAIVRRMGFALSEMSVYRLRFCEEVIELGVPFLFLIAIFQMASDENSKGEKNRI